MPGRGEVRSAELIASLCLATDLGMDLPFEHGLQSTLFAMRLAERVGVDSATATQTFYGCLLFYVGCTADAEVSAELFDDGALVTHFAPVMFGSPLQTMAGIARALAGPGTGSAGGAVRLAGRLPRAIAGHHRHVTALCEVAQMLSDQLGLPSSVRDLFAALTERWDGKGDPGRLRGDEIPLAVRIIHVARDAAFQRLLGGDDFAVGILRSRAGGAFDPAIASQFADDAADIMSLDDQTSSWEATLAVEPEPRLTLDTAGVDRALEAMGDFADLASPFLVGHAAGVSELAAAAARHCHLSTADVVTVRRAALVHDIGRVAVPTRIWQKPARLTPDDWERVRLHPYHSDRILSPAAFLATLAPVAVAHHERLDGSGYPRRATASALSPTARLLAVADTYHAMIEPRPHRAARSPEQAAVLLGQEAAAGRLDADGVAAVLQVAGHHVPHPSRPAGLTEREAQVIALLARGLQTKQIGRTLGISTKTADRHVQNAYAKMGVSTRAAAALFAMQHGLVLWGEFPISGGAPLS